LFKGFLEFLVFQNLELAFLDNEKGRPCGVFVINNSSIMLPLIELNRREVHFLLDILELGITEVIKDEMVPQRAQNKV
jgi:hypothetical protein